MPEKGDIQDRSEQLSEAKRSLLQKRLRGKGTKISKGDHISRRKDEDRPMLSFAQQRLWFLHQLEPASHAYNITFAYRIQGVLDIAVFERSFNEIVRRHETLRTTFVSVNGEPTQVISSTVELPLSVLDLEGLSEGDKEKKVHSTVSEESRHNFDLSKGPVFRATLLRSSATDHFFIFIVHHIAFDGWSAGVFFRELCVLYAAFSAGQPSPLSELPIQYADYSRWQREWLQGPVLADQLAYWKQQLGNGIPVLQLPTDRARPAVQTYNGATESFLISENLKNGLKKLSYSQGATLFMTLLAAFQALVYRYTGQEDFAIGSPIANRNRSEIENLIGFFVNTLVLKIDISGEQSFKDLLERVRDITLGAYEHQDLPFERLVEELQPNRDLSYSPLFQVMFVLLNVAMDPGEFPDLTMTPLKTKTTASMFDLSLYMQEKEEGLSGTFEYNIDLFDGATITRMAGHFENLLEAIVADPGQRLAEVPLLTKAERHQLLIDWNDTLAEYPREKCIHELFEEMVAGAGARVAVDFEGNTLSYTELNARANQLANYLIKSGVKPETYVGLYVERSLDLIVGLLGILKTGAAYVPMDPSFPPDRLAYMMEDAGITNLVTHEHLLEVFPQSDRKVICIDKQWDKIQHESAANPNIILDPTTLAYTIYTSGSTGKPKGVMLEHRAVVNFLISMQKEPGFTADDVLVGVTTISFDIAVLEMFLPLITGGKVAIAGKNEAIDGNLLLKLIERTSATILQATPATWKLMIEAGWEKTPGLKMLCGGEALPRELANNMLERGGELWNMYGPTETTIWSSIQKIEPGNDSILIGPPIANTQFYVVDREMEPVPIGVAGELLIGGDGLARGYLNRPNLTADRFIANPFANDGSRVYRTGDLARFRSSGEVEFIGRLDFQVKVRGFRIELGEIETQLTRHDDVKEAVVVVHEDEKGDKRLVAYIIPEDEKELNASDLRKFLWEKLPEYMIPSLFVKIDEFPLTPNAKIDRKALPDPAAFRLESESLHVEPRDELELQLAAIWQKALGVKNIGTKDNFFDLGGHSLLAARVFAQIESKIGVNLPLATLFQAPTIGQIAEILKQKDWKPSWNSLVPIRVKGTKPPLFLIHGAEGNVLLYKGLAYHLGEDQPVYGLQSQGLDGSEPLQTDFKSMAENYIKEIRLVQPVGPYCLGGYCMGGTIALEMAKQLKEAGDEVLLLAMFESYNIHAIPRPGSFFLNQFHKIQNIYFQMRNITLSQSGNRYQYFKEKAAVELDRLKIRFNIITSKVVSKMAPDYGLKYQHLQIKAVNDQAQVNYKPGKYDGKITILGTKINFYGLNDLYFGWGEVNPDGVEIINLPCFPRGSLNEPFVRILADKLIRKIDEISSQIY